MANWFLLSVFGALMTALITINILGPLVRAELKVDFLFFRLICVRRRQLLGVEVGFTMLPQMWVDWVVSRFP